MLKRYPGVRIAASEKALDEFGQGLRFAPDEAMVLGGDLDSISERMTALDPYAIVVPEGSFLGMTLDAGEVEDFFSRHCEWEPPSLPTFTQGAVAGIPAKVLFEEESVLILVQAPYAKDFEERL